MGVYIKGMEMPKDIEPGLVIEFADGIDGKRYARLYHYRHGGLTEWLEAVPVPPHGRLGDLDSLALLVLNWISTQEKAYPHEDSNALAWRLGAKAMGNQIYRDIKAYPTIIPAEEGE